MKKSKLRKIFNVNELVHKQYINEYLVDQIKSLESVKQSFIEEFKTEFLEFEQNKKKHMHLEDELDFYETTGKGQLQRQEL